MSSALRYVAWGLVAVVPGGALVILLAVTAWILWEYLRGERGPLGQRVHRAFARVGVAAGFRKP